MSPTANPAAPVAARKDAKILFQKYFKSSGPRTYAAQVKQAATGNHFLVLTEGRRDKASDEIHKNWLMLFSKDFPAFFQMLQETAKFIKANPVPEEVRQKQERFRAKAT